MWALVLQGELYSIIQISVEVNIFTAIFTVVSLYQDETDAQLY
jgi:hypothetical protein